ncbi:nitrogen fixation protein NifQ [Celerinatantimonas yamalensis]|uniref:Nitrogen fixation protein NifQ n=1 Tax=Celerinatantimonas yamalensis TaxID=559956 RepID=A0ABW9G3P3_9GAMM
MTDEKVQYWSCLLVARQRQGFGILGENLQLGENDYARLLVLANSCDTTPNIEQESLKARLLQLQKQRRKDEFQQLYQWLLHFQTPNDWDMAMVISSASMGFHHLWQDLGLPKRAMLTQLMVDCFPELAARNYPAMRWKKFFYRQLCLEHGALVCRSPSCDECTSYQECFEPVD